MDLVELRSAHLWSWKLHCNMIRGDQQQVLPLPCYKTRILATPFVVGDISCECTWTCFTATARSTVTLFCPHCDSYTTKLFSHHYLPETLVSFHKGQPQPAATSLSHPALLLYCISHKKNNPDSAEDTLGVVSNVSVTTNFLDHSSSSHLFPFAPQCPIHGKYLLPFCPPWPSA